MCNLRSAIEPITFDSFGGMSSTSNVQIQVSHKSIEWVNVPNTSETLRTRIIGSFTSGSKNTRIR